MKKLLSLILALTMVISLVPAAFAADGESETLVYTFSHTAKYGTDGKAPLAAATEIKANKTTNNVGLLDINNTVEGFKKWGFVNIKGDGTAKLTLQADRFDWVVNYQTSIDVPAFDGSTVATSAAVLGIDIYVPETRIYDTSISHYQCGNDGTYLDAEVFLIEKPTDANKYYAQEYESSQFGKGDGMWSAESLYQLVLDASANDRIGSFSGYDGTLSKVTANRVTNLGTRKITSGYYFLLIVPNGRNENTTNTTNTTKTFKSMNCAIHNFTLTPSTTTEEELAQSDAAKIQGETGSDATKTDANTAVTSVTVKQMSAILGEKTLTDVENVLLNNDGTATVTADETKDGKNFLYWVKGLSTGEERKIILPDSESEDTLSVTFKPTTGNNYIIAVYGDNTATTGKKYYNANGQLLENGDEYPTLAGYGKAKSWAEVGNGIYVAQYDEPTTTYTVTVKHQDGNAEAVTKETITNKKYGDLVTVTTAPERFNGTGYNTFNYWEKTDKTGATEIVSFDKDYSFYAFEECTVTAVYKAYEPIADSLRKIIIKGIDENNNIMAEFIGLSDAVEKGILFGGTSLTAGVSKTPMTTNSKQFSVENDDRKEYMGYAILSDGSVIYDK